MKKIIIICICFFSMQAFAQIDTPVHWKFASVKIDQERYAVSLTADIDTGWHIYSQFLKNGGPVPTTFKFDSVSGLSLVGKVTELPAAARGFDQSFQMTILYHERQVVFTQIVKTTDPKAHLTGSLNFMVCSGQKCLPPGDVNFDIPLSAVTGQSPPLSNQNHPVIKAATTTAVNHGDRSLLAIFLAGFHTSFQAAAPRAFNLDIGEYTSRPWQRQK